MERTLRVTCDEPDDPNFLRFCDDGENDIPYLKQFKFAGTYPLGWGIQASMSFQSINGRPIGGYTGTTADGPQQDQRPGLRRRRQPDRHAVADQPQPDLPGQLPRAVHARGGDRPQHDRGVDHGAAGPRRSGADGPHQPARPVACQVVRARRQPPLQLQADVFNIMNGNPVTGWRSVNFGTAAYSQVSAMLNPRVLRLGAQFKW